MNRTKYLLVPVLPVFLLFLTADVIFAQNRILKNFRQYKAPVRGTVINEPVVHFASPVVEPLPGKPISSNAVTVIPLGTSANGLGWGYSGGQRTHIWADDNLKTLALIHRMGPGSSPPGLSGYLAVDKAVNMGQTAADWTLNWQVYASNLYSGGNYLDQARYPQLGIYNPDGNTDPDNSYIHFFAPLANPSGQLGNYAHGRVKWNSQADSTKKFNWFTPPPNHGAPGGFFISADGKAYTIDVDVDPLTGHYNGNLVLGIGILNAATKDFDYTYTLLPLPESLGNLPLSPRVAADHDGKNVWVVCLASPGYPLATPVFDSTYYPVLWKSLDFGNTWSNPIAVTLDGPNGIPCILNFISDYRLNILFNNNPPPRDQISYSTAFDCDLVVDHCGGPRIAVGVHMTGNTGFSVSAADSAFGIFDVYSIDKGTTWCARWLGGPKHFRGWYDQAQGFYEDNRPNISISNDGLKIFYTWLDSQNPADTANDHPDLFARGWDIPTGKLTNSSGRDDAVNVTAGSALSRAAFFGDASSSVFTLPSGSWVIPLVTESLSSGNLINPVSYNYIPDFKFSMTDFTIWEKAQAWGTNCDWPSSDDCFWGSIKETGNGSFSVSADPNPARDFVNLSLTLTSSGNISIDLYSVMGQCMLHRDCSFRESGNHSVGLDLTGLSPGIYFYSVSMGSEKASGKLIVE